MKYSNFCPAAKSGSSANNWKSIISLSRIKYLLLVGLFPTFNLPSGVAHTGASGPCTIILYVLSSILFPIEALNTKLKVFVYPTSKGVPTIL